MADENKFDSGHIVVPVLHPGGDVHHVAVPSDTDLGDLHSALIDSNYHFPMPVGPTKEGSIEYSPAFKKAASDLWMKAGLGKRPGEASTYIDARGQTGTPQWVSEDADSSKPVVSKVTAPRDVPVLMHTHPDSRSDQPSRGVPSDVDTASHYKKTVYVVSKSGLWAADPSGKVTQVFKDPHWMLSKEPK